MDVKVWMRELRLPFATLSIVLVVLGASTAWYVSGIFEPFYFLLTFFGVLFIHLGTNVVNDYFDSLKGRTDWINKELTPFSGGSQVIQKKLLTPKKVYKGAILLFALAIAIGFYLSTLRGWQILPLGLIGVFSGYFYVHPKINIAARGIGELVVGLNFGPLLMLGVYFVQVQSFALQPLLVGIVMGTLVGTVLWINEFPDYNADKKGGKRTMVVRIGREKAAEVYKWLLASVYVIIALAVAFGFFPVLTLVAFITLPLAYNSIKTAKKFHSNTKKLIPANAGTIKITLQTGVLLALAFVISRFI